MIALKVAHAYFDLHLIFGLSLPPLVASLGAIQVSCFDLIILEGFNHCDKRIVLLPAQWDNNIAGLVSA